MSKDKPREFWLKESDHWFAEFFAYDEPLGDIKLENQIHVIEYSAYAALEATEEGWRLKAREAMAKRDAREEKLREADEIQKSLLNRIAVLEKQLKGGE